MTENRPIKKPDVDLNSEEKEYQTVFWVEGLIAPDKEMVFNDSLLIQGVPKKDDAFIYVKTKKSRGEDVLKFGEEYTKTLGRIFQIYGLVSNCYVQVPSGFCSSKITPEKPFGKINYIFVKSETLADEKAKEQRKPLIEKTINKYNLIKDIYENKNKFFLRNAIDYYNRALNDGEIEEKLIDLMIALESLFSENGELAFKYSLRLAFLVGSGEKDRRSEIVDLIKELYKKRSKIVHGTGTVDVESEDVYHFEDIINQAIRILLHIKLNKRAIIKLLDEAIYSDDKKEELNKLVIKAIAEW